MAPQLAEAAITSDSTVTLTILWTLLGATIVGTSAAMGIWYRLGAIARTLEHLLRNGWTVQDHSVWAAKLGQRNRDLDVPDVEKIQDSE